MVNGRAFDPRPKQVAMAGRALPWHVNAIIAACNAAGALTAAAFGIQIGKAAPTLAPCAAALIFFYLGYEEIASWRSGEPASPLAKSAADGLVWKLAVPMTLNNLAGGVAGGAVGIGPLQAGFCALLASYLMCGLGHRLGKTIGPQLEGCIEPRLVGAAIFFIVALMQVHGVVASL